MARAAKSVHPLLTNGTARAKLDRIVSEFPALVEQTLDRMYGRKFGLGENAGGQALFREVEILLTDHVDMTMFFRLLSEIRFESMNVEKALRTLRPAFYDEVSPEDRQAWEG